MEFQDLSLKRKILKIIFPNLNVDYKHVSRKELIDYLIGNKKIKVMKNIYLSQG